MQESHRPVNSYFRPDVEGLRALAVLMVIAYHAGLPLTGGFVGVDVFFVVSGFLITSLLLREGSSGEFSLREFWARRVRRLLPASTLVAACTAVLGLWLLESSRVRGLAGDVVAAATFSSNFRFASTTDYLAGVSLPSPLLHYWSLAVEEQFYLLWPLVFVAAFRFRSPRRVVFIAAITLACLSFVVSVVTSTSDPSSAYYLLPSRAWELLAGSLLAFVPSRAFASSSLRALRSAATFAALVVLLAACFAFGTDTVFPGFAALLPVAATGVLLVTVPGTMFAGFFASSPLRWIGARSYSLYLWHWPVLVLAEARFGVLSGPTTWLCVLLAVVLADLTFRFVEDPTRRSRLLARRPSFSLAAGGCLVSVTLICGALLVLAAPAGSSVTLTANVPTPSPVTSAPGATATSAPDSSTVSPSTASPSTVPPSPVVDLGRVLLVGDSTLAPLRWFESGLLGLSGFDFRLDAESCRRIMLASCEGRERRTPESVTELLAGFTATGDLYDTVVLMGGYHAYEDTIVKEFRGFVDAARTHGADRIVVLDWRESLAFPARGSQGEVSVYTRFNELIRAELAGGGYDDVVLLGWHAYTAARPEWFRSDGIHVNLSGTLVLGEFISDSLAALANRPCPGDLTGVVCIVPVTASPRDVLSEYGVPDTDMHCYEYGSSREPGCRKDKLA